tara:strand:- start:104 stop:238 length:135 start_codon:yes stop_codon:yes gene_type:complete
MEAMEVAAQEEPERIRDGMEGVVEEPNRQVELVVPIAIMIQQEA